MIPVKHPARLLKRARALTAGETIIAGDIVRVGSATFRVTPLDTRTVGTLVGSQSRPVFRPAAPPDPLVVATKRARARTTLGRLEALLVERAAARRRLTTALTRLDLVEKKIAALGRTLAEARFASDLNPSKP